MFILKGLTVGFRLLGVGGWGDNESLSWEGILTFNISERFRVQKCSGAYTMHAC